MWWVSLVRKLTFCFITCVECDVTRLAGCIYLILVCVSAVVLPVAELPVSDGLWRWVSVDVLSLCGALLVWLRLCLRSVAVAGLMHARRLLPTVLFACYGRRAWGA